MPTLFGLQNVAVSTSRPTLSSRFFLFACRCYLAQWFFVGSVLAPLVPVIGQRAVLGLSGYVINNIGFVFAAVYLYRLSVVILDHEAAVRPSILFGLNPASIFYSSMGVGLLRYFQVKQLPNFLLASPILSLALFSIVHYAKSKPETFFSLGFRAPPEDKGSGAVLFSLAEYSSRSQENRYLKARNQVNKDCPALVSEEHKLSAKQGYLSVAVLPCILHLGFMAATTFFAMHVQIDSPKTPNYPNLPLASLRLVLEEHNFLIHSRPLLRINSRVVIQERCESKRLIYTNGI